MLQRRPMPFLTSRARALSSRDALPKAETLFLDLLWCAAKATGDPDAASDLGAFFGRLIGPHAARNRHVLANLHTAFPDWPPHRVRDTAAKAWTNFGRVVAEYPFLPEICDPVRGRIRVVDMGGLALVRRTGKPGVFVSAHLANWNLAPAVANQAGVPLTVIYTPLKNTGLETRIKSHLAAVGCVFLEAKRAGRQMLRELQQGRSLGIVMDQRYDRGAKVPFFGVPASTSLGPAKLALRLGLPLIPTRVQRLGKARFQITVHRPLMLDFSLPEAEAAQRATSRINELFARWITDAPEQWLCPKRRWPRTRIGQPKHGKVSTT
jgi:KDO2-lipid IV(A) lauroyltransferase